MPFIQNTVNRIYHYCKLTTARDFILPNKQLLLSPIIKTNDPRENKSFVFSITAYNRTFTLSEITDINKKVSDSLRDDCKVICFSRDNKDFFGSEYSRMWAHYGGSHKGVCLELDKEEFIRENPDKIVPDLFKDVFYWELDINNVPKHKVIDYTQIERLGFDEYSKNVFRPNHTEYLFFTKNKEWESEREMRLIYFSSTKDNEYCSIKKSLKNIYLGVDFDKADIIAINSLKGDADIYELKLGDVRLIKKSN